MEIVEGRNMREILFKGKRVDNGRWVYGFCWYVEKYHNLILIKRHFIKSLITFKDIEVIPETVGQFTGLTDKNGTKIFEGDIVQHKEKTWLIEFDQGMFGTKTLNQNPTILDSLAQVIRETESLIEVIGNIHERGNDD